MHFFDARIPAVPGATVIHADATPEHYRAFQKTIGTVRCVVVQPSVYGYDNRPTLAGLAALGDAARGVVVVPPGVTDAELERLHAAGVRGVRFNLVQAGGLKLTDAEGMAPRLHALGWHIQFQLPRGGIAPALDVLSKLPGRMVFDHMGLVAGIDDPGMHGLLNLLETGRVWIKLSGPYIHAVDPASDYANRLPIARRFVQTAPERMVWASDWPHATETKKPDDAALFDLLADWAPDEKIRRAVLVDNPAELYGFR